MKPASGKFLPGTSNGPVVDDRTAAALATLALPVHQAIAEVRDPAAAYAERIGALFHLADSAGNEARRAGGETLACLGRMLQEERLGSRRQDLFLARKAAEVLLVLACAPEPELADNAWTVLGETLRRTRGLVHRGTAEAIGALPCLDGGRTRIDLAIGPVGQPVAWEKILDRAGMKTPLRIKPQGRSLLMRNGLAGRLLVVKRARAGQDPLDLAREAGWMTWLAAEACRFGCRFEVPVPLEFNGVSLIRLAGRLPAAASGDDLHPEGWAICYLAPDIYFVYPNDSRPECRPAAQDFVEIMARAARLMGTLAGQGIIHEAPIPLFHNRVQRHRRRDAGRYEWFRGGRLDRWLASCAYPNWGPNGLRDFEHLVEFSGPPMHLYRHLGNHFLSLLLVAGSYFRAGDIDRKGHCGDGKPVDARDLFDAELLDRVITETFRGYYRGFVGQEPPEPLPLDPAVLTARMIEEMGVDRHMEEILRVADQNAMSREQFCIFLRRRGFAAEQIAGVAQGEKDLTVLTGPHLGGFNQPISLPELITAVEGMAAACVAGRWRRRATGMPRGHRNVQ